MDDVAELLVQGIATGLLYNDRRHEHIGNEQFREVGTLVVLVLLTRAVVCSQFAEFVDFYIQVLIRACRLCVSDEQKRHELMWVDECSIFDCSRAVICIGEEEVVAYQFVADRVTSWVLTIWNELDEPRFGFVLDASEFEEDVVVCEHLRGDNAPSVLRVEFPVRLVI